MNMIEKVARAMFDADYGGVVSWDELNSVKANSVKVKSYARHAKAAILAMREPSEGMLSIFPGTSGNGNSYPDEEAKAIWIKMIDAALKEE